MRLFAALVAYIIYAASAGAYGWLYLVLPQTTDQYGVVTYSPDYVPYYVVGMAIATIFLVLTPYFGIAALQGASSVWKRAVALMDRHISFPFLAALFLAYIRPFVPLYGSLTSPGSISYNSVLGAVIASYTFLVAIASIMVVMAYRSETTSTYDLTMQPASETSTPAAATG